MSPGAVVKLRSHDDEVFIKAVGHGLNARTPELYRHEAAVLNGLPSVPYRPPLRGVFDDGEWVAIALESIDGEHPDLDIPEQLAVVRDLLVTQSVELSTLRPPVGALSDLASAWLFVWDDERSVDVMPDWIQERRQEYGRRVARVPDRLSAEQLVHWDVRDDNMLLRADGSAVIFDWGMSRIGPAWADLFLLALRHPADPRFDDEVSAITDLLGNGPDPDLVDDFLILFGVRLAFMAAYRPEQGIPAITLFRHRQSAQMLDGARRRLGI